VVVEEAVFQTALMLKVKMAVKKKFGRLLTEDMSMGLLGVLAGDVGAKGGKGVRVVVLWLVSQMFLIKLQLSSPFPHNLELNL
jgi:hypothetical protein